MEAAKLCTMCEKNITFKGTCTTCIFKKRRDAVIAKSVQKRACKCLHFSIVKKNLISAKSVCLGVL